MAVNRGSMIDGKILIVDPDPDHRERIAAAIQQETGREIILTDNPEQALKTVKQTSIALLVINLSPSIKNGLDFIDKIHTTHPAITLIAGVPENDRQSAIESLRLGAFMHITFPYDTDEAALIASRGLAFSESRQPPPTVQKPRSSKNEGFHGIIGNSLTMLQLFDLIKKVADDDASTVLIQGESGTGKELVAQVIHAQGPRRGKNIVPVNCAAIPDELLESELFGYVKGAFTGASHSKMGRIQYADGGTLFLDEIGDMKPSLQAKLLRVIQEKEFEPVGGLKPIPIDIRIIAATHRNLEKMVEDGSFRADLYYRLSVVPIQIPPLRERPEDIPLLADKFVKNLNKNKDNPLLGFEKNAMAALGKYQWPGNIRELENLIQHMTILHAGETVQLASLPAKYQPSGNAPRQQAPGSTPAAQAPGFSWNGGNVDFNSLITEFENQLIHKALSLTNGNKKEAAKLLNLKRTTLIEKIKKKDIRLEVISQPASDSFPDEFRFFP